MNGSMIGSTIAAILLLWWALTVIVISVHSGKDHKNAPSVSQGLQRGPQGQAAR